MIQKTKTKDKDSSQGSSVDSDKSLYSKFKKRHQVNYLVDSLVAGEQLSRLNKLRLGVIYPDWDLGLAQQT